MSRPSYTGTQRGGFRGLGLLPPSSCLWKNITPWMWKAELFINTKSCHNNSVESAFVTTSADKKPKEDSISWESSLESSPAEGCTLCITHWSRYCILLREQPLCPGSGTAAAMGSSSLIPSHSIPLGWISGKEDWELLGSYHLSSFILFSPSWRS